jgi:hypothetical protein
MTHQREHTKTRSTQIGYLHRGSVHRRDDLTYCVIGSTDVPFVPSYDSRMRLALMIHSWMISCVLVITFMMLMIIFQGKIGRRQ